MNTALTHKMAVATKVRWWELRGMDLEDMKKEGRWVNRKRLAHLNLLREVVWKVPRAPPIEEEDPDELVTTDWETEIRRFGGCNWDDEDTTKELGRG